MRLTIGRESLILVAICAADAVSTIALVATGLAVEANPLMARCLEYGFAVFWLVKMSTVVAAVAVAELYRRHNPLFVRQALRMGIAAYVGLYLVLLATVNLA